MITDFGIALSAEQTDMRLTESDELVGTPEYMAPEQAEPGPATPATDIYALGLIALRDVEQAAAVRHPRGRALATVLVRRRSAAEAAATRSRPPRWTDLGRGHPPLPGA